MTENDKRAFRKEALKRRAQLAPSLREEKSLAICGMILNSEAYRCCGTLFVYIPYKSEADIMPVIREAWKSGKTVASPLVDGDGIMHFVRIRGEEDLTEGFRGIREPKEDLPTVFPDERTLALVPGCAFTLEGARMGYGGGYYDRYLNAHSTMKSAGVCFLEQLVPELPKEETDANVDSLFYF